MTIDSAHAETGAVPATPAQSTTSTLLLTILGCGAAVIALLAVFLTPFLVSDTAADKLRHQQLLGLLQEYRALRARSATELEWSNFQERALAISEPIVRDVTPHASRSQPHKQFLLWSAKNRLREMLDQAQNPYVPAEFDYEHNLYETAQLLKIPMNKPASPPLPPPRPGRSVNVPSSDAEAEQ